MSQYTTAVVVDTGELRSAAASLRHTARQVIDLAGNLPREAWGAPVWLAGWAADELGSIRLGLDELIGDLETEARALEARADEVDTAEQRWWEIADGELRCGCVLPDGSLVALPVAATAASSTSGPGIAEALGLGTVVGGVGAGFSSAPGIAEALGLGTVVGGVGAGYVGGPAIDLALGFGSFVGGTSPGFTYETGSLGSIITIGGSIAATNVGAWSYDPGITATLAGGAVIGGSSWGAGYAPADATDLDAILKLQAQIDPRGPVVGSGGSPADLINSISLQTLNQQAMTNIYNNMHNIGRITSPTYVDSQYFNTQTQYESYNNMRG